MVKRVNLSELNTLAYLNAGSLRQDALLLYKNRSYSRAAALLVFCLEELGKAFWSQKVLKKEITFGQFVHSYGEHKIKQKTLFEFLMRMDKTGELKKGFPALFRKIEVGYFNIIKEDGLYVNFDRKTRKYYLHEFEREDVGKLVNLVEVIFATLILEFCKTLKNVTEAALKGGEKAQNALKNIFGKDKKEIAIEKVKAAILAQ